MINLVPTGIVLIIVLVGHTSWRLNEKLPWSRRLYVRRYCKSSNLSKRGGATKTRATTTKLLLVNTLMRKMSKLHCKIKFTQCMKGMDVHLMETITTMYTFCFLHHQELTIKPHLPTNTREKLEIENEFSSSCIFTFLWLNGKSFRPLKKHGYWY